MKIKTNISKKQMEFVRKESSYRFPSTLKFDITIKDTIYKANLVVETLRLEKTAINLDGSKIYPIERKFNKIYIENIDIFLIQEIMNIAKIKIDDYWYYGSSNNSYEIKEGKIISELMLIQY